MAGKTGPLGIRYSPWSIIFTVIVIGIAYELTAPAAWQLVGALPKGFIVAVLLIGACTIFTAFLSDNVNRFQFGLKLISGALLLSLLSLFGHAVYFYYPAPNVVAATHIAYSSRQVLEISNIPGGYNQTLNLDNVATLRLAAPFNRESVTLLWTTLPSITIDEPPQFPPIITRGEVIARGSQYITFDVEHPVQLIRVDGRIFGVSLEDIHDKKTPDRIFWFEYDFAISEVELTAENLAAAINQRTAQPTPEGAKP